MRGRPWSQEEEGQLIELVEQGFSDAEISARIGRPRTTVTTRRQRMGKKSPNPAFFLVNRVVSVFSFKLPISKGVEKLLRRLDTLEQWVSEGRDNYELARAFHVPIGDVAYVVGRLGLVRPYEDDGQPEIVMVQRACLSCRSVVALPRGRFRCDACHGSEAGLAELAISGGFSGECYSY